MRGMWRLFALAGAAWLLASAPGWAAPTVLSAQDVTRYRQIFALQDKARWRAADRLIGKLDNRLLLGRVLYQRYMHPTGYRSRYRELANWMKHYADQPDAVRIYRLALRRRGKGAALPRKPVRIILRRAPAGSSEAVRGKKSPLEKRVARYLRRGRADRAEKRLWAAQHSGKATGAVITRLLARTARVDYFATRYDKAEALAIAALDLAAERHLASPPDAMWIAGLSAWRASDHQTALGFFARLARDDQATGSQRAAGGYWAARAALAARAPERVNDNLRLAAAEPDSFYGQIAAWQLARDPAFSWDVPALDPVDAVRLSARPAIARAIALSQIGQMTLADREFRRAIGRARPADDTALLALATALDLPASQLALSRLVRPPGAARFDAAAYPAPDWQPRGGFTVDRALLLAIMRQESRFDSRARSASGARGLMQIMPRTASYITRDHSLRYGNRAKLFAPEFNLAVGQRYVDYLRNLKVTGGNLFLIAAAYNGGPGNLARWRRTIDSKGDGLLFIESIPARETRDYVKQVMRNFWIYRARLGQPAPSLNAVASGGWPAYTALDNRIVTTARLDDKTP